MPPTILAELAGPDGAPVRIRRPESDDAAAVLAYLRRMGGESSFLSFGEEGPPISEPEERIFLAGMATADNGLAIIAEWNGEMVGYLTFTGGNRRRTRHAGEFGITVARQCQGIGLGRRLMEILIDWAAAGGIIRKINLLVQVDNSRAIRLYETLGFEVEGRKRRDILRDGEFHDAFLMGLLIEPAKPAGDHPSDPTDSP